MSHVNAPITADQSPNKEQDIPDSRHHLNHKQLSNVSLPNVSSISVVAEGLLHPISHGCFVHLDGKINCTLLGGIDERNIYVF